MIDLDKLLTGHLKDLNYSNGSVVMLHPDDFNQILGGCTPRDNILFAVNDGITKQSELVRLVKGSINIGRGQIGLGYMKSFDRRGIDDIGFKLETKCDCGAIHTSFPKHHLNWCSLQGNV